MDLFLVIIKTIFLYIFILVIFRLMGKREIKELSIGDLVISLLITEIASISIENYKESILFSVAPILILLLFEIFGSYLSIKFNKFKHFVDGKPSLIINKGKINYKEMIKQRYALDDLMLELRNNNIKDLKDVEYAVLENNGNLNIFKYEFLDRNSDLPFPLILDGSIQKSTLDYLEKNEKWLINNLKGINIEEIFYAFYKNNKVYIIKRNELNF